MRRLAAYDAVSRTMVTEVLKIRPGFHVNDDPENNDSTNAGPIVPEYATPTGIRRTPDAKEYQAGRLGTPRYRRETWSPERTIVIVLLEIVGTALFWGVIGFVLMYLGVINE